MNQGRIILDTNIWVSYFIKAQLTELVDIIMDNNLIVYSSNELIAELTEVMSRKKISKYLSLPVTEYIDFHCDLVTVIQSLYNSKVALTLKMIIYSTWQQK